ncbi:DUF1552 domain-containing protein [Thiohalocapsa sp. ML1]|uniref:DUF1552 domain-containing protein n=1 Tax=Thiohalocapsa sp. ML1 TaxID=1431688 RepID=UPI00073206F2|nr:DUF1552 domain-containing protein [Thiohalocapsa sp. ML1]
MSKQVNPHRRAARRGDAGGAPAYSPARRGFLRTLGAASLGAALSPLTWGLARPAVAQVSAPRRVIFVYVPNGVTYRSWHPVGAGSDFTLPVMTAPLQPVRQHCVFLRGVDMYGSAGTHEGGQVKMLSGRSGHMHDPGPTLDWYLGERFKTAVPRPFLNLGVIGNEWSKPITFDAAGKAMNTDDNPLAVFERLFGTDATQDALIARRRSLIDRSLAEVNALKTRLGGVEQQKLELHLESIRAVERTLGDVVAGSCDTAGFNTQGFTVTRNEHLSHANFATVGRLQTDLAVLSLACDLTRVVTLKWAYPVTPVIIPSSGSSMPCHQASHMQDGNFDLIKAWFAARFADLVGALAAYPDGAGSLLDNTLIWMFSELGDSSGHNHRNMPFVLAGGGAAGIAGNRVLDYGNAAHNKILVSMARFAGVPISEFGNTDSNPGELGGLVAGA